MIFSVEIAGELEAILNISHLEYKDRFHFLPLPVELNIYDLWMKISDLNFFYE